MCIWSLSLPLNPWNVLSAEGHKDVSCYVNEVTFAKLKRAGPLGTNL